MPSSARYALLGAGPESTGMVRLPDGSIIMTGHRAPVQQPGLLDRLKALLPQRFDPQPPPWWIPQAQPAPSQAAPPIPAPIMAGRVNPWGEIAAQTAKQEEAASQLGELSRKVMNSPQLIEGKWFSAPTPK